MHDAHDVALGDVQTAEHDAAPTTIYLVRHGATAWNARGVYQGRADIPLSPDGIAEVQALAAQLRGVRFDAAYTSTLVRARHTAELLLHGTGLRASRVAELDELSYGVFQGLEPAERERLDAALDRRWQSDPWSVAFPSGESLDDVARRARPVWEQIVGAHAGETVLVAGHGHVNRVLLLHALARPREEFWSIAQGNACLDVLRCTPTSATSHDWRDVA